MENQHDILKTVIDGLVYIPTKDMIVKPLEDEYVEKEIIKPVETGKKDENGYDINDTETVKEKVLTTSQALNLLKQRGYFIKDDPLSVS